jgi:hypothetical protein
MHSSSGGSKRVAQAAGIEFEEPAQVGTTARSSFEKCAQLEGGRQQPRRARRKKNLPVEKKS